VVVKTGLPVAKTLDWVNLSFQDSIAVPDDAWADWDATKQVFISAKDRLAAATAAKAKDPKAADAGYAQTANMQVTFTYSPDLFKTTWHDGSPMSVADFVMDMILTFDPGKAESKIYDEGYATSTLSTFMTHFKGVKIVSTSPLTITTWDDTYQLDAENTAYTWFPATGEGYTYGSAAWHNMAPMIAAEADGKMAMSLDKSTSKKVDESSLVAGPTLAIQSTYLDTFAASGDVPYAPTLSQYVTAADAKARYANLQAFYKAHNNMSIGTGPYFVDKVDSTAGSVTLTRYDKYLFPADQFASLGSPELITATVDGPTQVKAGDDAPFTVTVTTGGKPYPSTDLDTVAYTVFGSDGAVAASGTATKAAEGSYTIDLTAAITGKLIAGSSALSVAVSSKTVSMPAFVTYQFVVTQ
jgi:peptide/nickel transport system substrate-binding protein